MASVTPILKLVSGPSESAREDTPDADLVRQVLRGDREAFERLYRRHAPFAINLAVRLQGNRLDIEDLVHDAFLKAHQELAGLREPKLFRSWLGSILVSQLRSRLRRNRLLRGLGGLGLGSLGLGRQEPIEIDSLASAEAGPETRAELAQLYSLLRLMPTDDRIAWTLRCVERHRLEEVAQIVGCSLATVKRRILRSQRFIDAHYVSSNEMASHGPDDADSSPSEVNTAKLETPPKSGLFGPRGARTSANGRSRHE